MSFVTSLLQVPSLVETFAASLASNPTIKRLESYLPTVAFVLITRQFSFEVDGYLVTAKVNGNPASFTPSAALLAIENVMQGKVGTFVCGVIELDISHVAPPAATATPTPA